jgi:hypothetical protein
MDQEQSCARGSMLIVAQTSKDADRLGALGMSPSPPTSDDDDVVHTGYWAQAEVLAKQRGAVNEMRHGVAYGWFCFCHHTAIACAFLAMIAFGFCPSFPALCAWWVYGDFYSAVLHCALDHKRSTTVPVIGPVATAFQEHHNFPNESTLGKGLPRMLDDVVRIQYICGVVTWMLGQRTTVTAVHILMKCITTAYGTQIGHYFAHCPQHAPTVIKWLQRTGLLLPPAHHSQHHKDPYEKNFGIVNGLSNPITNLFLSNETPFPAIFSAWIFLTAYDIVVIERLFYT